MTIKTFIWNRLSRIFLTLYRQNISRIEKIQETVFIEKLGYFDKTSVIHFPIHAEPRSNVFIREHVNIAPYVQIWANEKVIIGKNTLIASHVIITTSTHNYHVKPIRATRIDKPITIGEDVWIGSGAIIFPGVTIGNGAVIGAGSLVTKDVEPNSIYYGVPAKKMKDREVDTFLDDQSNSE